jgi:NADH:ubiquinone oxidoreductase subunit 6 (subunit J)
MILEVLSIGLIISACLALFLDEVVYSVAALAGTFLFTAALYIINGAPFAAIFQFAIGIGTLAVLFLSGEMLNEKAVKKTSLKGTLTLVGVGLVLSLPAVFLSVSSPVGQGTNASFSNALWNLRGLDDVLEGIVILTVAIGIAIVLFEKKRNGGK